MDGVRCRECVFFTDYGGDQPDGFCRAHPPNVLTSRRSRRFSDVEDPNPNAEFPEVDFDDWCGEFRTPKDFETSILRRCGGGVRDLDLHSDESFTERLERSTYVRKLIERVAELEEARNPATPTAVQNHLVARIERIEAAMNELVKEPDGRFAFLAENARDCMRKPT